MMRSCLRILSLPGRIKHVGRIRVIAMDSAAPNATQAGYRHPPEREGNMDQQDARPWHPAANSEYARRPVTGVLLTRGPYRTIKTSGKWPHACAPVAS